MSVKKVTCYKTEDGKTFEDEREALLHDHFTLSKSRLSDLVIQNYQGVEDWFPGFGLQVTQTILSRFHLIERDHPVDIGELEVHLSENRHDGERPDRIEDLLVLILKSETYNRA